MIDFDTTMLIVIAGVFLFTCVSTFRTLRRGWLRWGDASFTRTEQPVEFWFFTLVGPVAVLAFGVELLMDSLSPEDRTPSFILPLWLGSITGFLLVRALQTQRISMGVTFERAEEPREYWLLVLLYAVPTLALPLYVVLFLA